MTSGTGSFLSWMGGDTQLALYTLLKASNTCDIPLGGGCMCIMGSLDGIPVRKSATTFAKVMNWSNIETGFFIWGNSFQLNSSGSCFCHKSSILILSANKSPIRLMSLCQEGRAVCFCQLCNSKRKSRELSVWMSVWPPELSNANASLKLLLLRRRKKVHVTCDLPKCSTCLRGDNKHSSQIPPYLSYMSVWDRGEGDFPLPYSP